LAGVRRSPAGSLPLTYAASRTAKLRPLSALALANRSAARLTYSRNASLSVALGQGCPGPSFALRVSTNSVLNCSYSARVSIVSAL
jgi:hypothetical protein